MWCSYWETSTVFYNLNQVNNIASVLLVWLLVGVRRLPWSSENIQVVHQAMDGWLIGGSIYRDSDTVKTAKTFWERKTSVMQMLLPPRTQLEKPLWIKIPISTQTEWIYILWHYLYRSFFISVLLHFSPDLLTKIFNVAFPFYLQFSFQVRFLLIS